ncbi:MAG: hypothetical protein ACHQUC_02835 [Chlamydiales bacterium]
MENQNSKNSDIVNYNVTLDVSIWDHIEKQVVLNKSTKDITFSKRRWILDSILEKLSNVAVTDVVIQKRKSISFAINKFIQKKIEKVISFYRKIDATYSKNQFFLDAITEKVEREKKQLDNTLRSHDEIEAMLDKLLSSDIEITK